MIKQIFDRTSYEITSRTFTDEGFLRVPGRVARAGIQDYLAVELGLDGDPMRIVRVMRPESEVFKKESLDSYNGADATNNHPSDLVNPDTYKATTVGVCVGSGKRDGDFVTCDMIIKDAQAIKDIEAGKVQLSAGYTSVYKDAPADADYEFIQTDIKINHVALVDRARAGMQAKLFDQQTKGPTMIKVSLDSGREIEVEDKAVAALVTDSIERLKKAVTDAEAKASKADAEKDKANDELEEEKKKSSDSAIAAKVAEIVKVNSDARKIAGDSFTCDSTDVVEIMRAALKDARPKRDFADKSADYIAAAFDMEKDVEDEDEKKDDKEKIAKDAAAVATTSTDAYAKRCKDGEASWKKTLGIN